MKRINIDDKLYEAIELYCKENNLVPREYINSLLEKEFTIDKYGNAPPFFKKNEVIPVPEVVQPVITQTVKLEEPEKKEEIVEVKPSDSQKKKEARRRIQNL